MVERKDKIKVESSIEIKRLKLVIVGEGGTGKSSILKKYCYNSFESRYNATIGADFMTRSVEYMGKEVKLNMWDMGGHAEYYEVRNEFYKESDALIMVYDIASKKSFDALDNWIREASKCGGELLPVWVVGNKVGFFWVFYYLGFLD